MNILYAMLGGFALDWLFGDPAWLTHPVVIMGKAISALERALRARLPKTPRGERLGGLTLAIVLPVGTLLLTGRRLPGAGRGSSAAWLCGRAALVRAGAGGDRLAQESTNVYRQLEKDDLPAARKAVSRIVGRDTEKLTREGVTKAAVETVAENASDGVIAPLFYMMLGGAPLALTYKAVNTMDSMVGYKNEQYLNFGRAAAKLDDAGELPAQPDCGALVDCRGGADGKRRERRVAHLAARPAQPCQPEQRADGKRLRRGAGRSAGRAGNLFRRILRQADHRRRGARDRAEGHSAGQPDDARRQRAGADCRDGDQTDDRSLTDETGTWRRHSRLSGTIRT